MPSGAVPAGGGKKKEKEEKKKEDEGEGLGISEADHEGVVDLVQEEAVYFRGAKGETVERAPVPSALAGPAAAAGCGSSLSLCPAMFSPGTHCE